MNSRVLHHPTEKMLSEFIDGNLNTGLSVVISAHIELCEMCCARRSELEGKAALAWEKEAGQQESAERDFTPLLASITSKLREVPQETELNKESTPLQEIHMLEGSVKLPKVLAKLAGEGLVWKKLAGGINQAAITLDDQTQCEFIYMKPGSQVPVHKHRGNEITLVLDGSFSDELGSYKAADFVTRDSSHQHQPASEEGCLCFAVQDSPLKFTRGLARLLNPLIKYRFKQALSRAN